MPYPMVESRAFSGFTKSVRLCHNLLQNIVAEWKVDLKLSPVSSAEVVSAINNLLYPTLAQL